MSTSELFPLHPDLARVLDNTQQALSMLLHGFSLPYGHPPEHIDGCTEAEAIDACKDALVDLHSLLAKDAKTKAVAS